MSPSARKPNRGIRIALSRKSWELICEALTYVVEKPHLDDLEESRGRIGKLLRHVQKKLDELGEKRAEGQGGAEA